MKKFITLILSASFIFAFTITATHAKENSTNVDNYMETDFKNEEDLAIHWLDKFFSSNSNMKAYDKEGTDITESIFDYREIYSTNKKENCMQIFDKIDSFGGNADSMDIKNSGNLLNMKLPGRVAGWHTYKFNDVKTGKLMGTAQFTIVSYQCKWNSNGNIIYSLPEPTDYYINISNANGYKIIARMDWTPWLSYLREENAYYSYKPWVGVSGNSNPAFNDIYIMECIPY